MAKIYDIRAKIGEYEKDGETKSRYATIGAVLETKNGNQMIKVDMIPMDWDGFAYLNEPFVAEDNKSAITGREVSENVSISDVPF